MDSWVKGLICLQFLKNVYVLKNNENQENGLIFSFFFFFFLFLNNTNNKRTINSNNEKSFQKNKMMFFVFSKYVFKNCFKKQEPNKPKFSNRIDS